MAQVTIYMDNNLESQVKDMAKNAGVSISKYISKVLEQKVGTHWDKDIKNLAGSWNDFSTIEELRGCQATDIKREEF